jgi:hypothetical protein
MEWQTEEELPCGQVLANRDCDRLPCIRSSTTTVISKNNDNDDEQKKIDGSMLPGGYKGADRSTFGGGSALSRCFGGGGMTGGTMWGDKVWPWATLRGGGVVDEWWVWEGIIVIRGQLTITKCHYSEVTAAGNGDNIGCRGSEN